MRAAPTSCSAIAAARSSGRLCSRIFSARSIPPGTRATPRSGLSAKFGKRIYIRPGLGIAVHTGSAKKFQDLSNDKIDFGSRVLFEPEIAIGAQINGRLSIEASWVHMSHAQFFARQNPGIDNLGVRLNLAL